MTARAISKIERGISWDVAATGVWCDSPEGSNAGNGSVMRCAPLAIAYPGHLAALVRTSMVSSRITHADPRCTYGCAVLNLFLAGILNDRDEPLSEALHLLENDPQTRAFHQGDIVPGSVASVLEGGMPDELRSALEVIPSGVDESRLSNTGYVVSSLQTALYDGLNANSAEDAIVAAVNRGGDADTIGAVAGAVAGARFGATSFPKAWLKELRSRDGFLDADRNALVYLADTMACEFNTISSE